MSMEHKKGEDLQSTFHRDTWDEMEGWLEVLHGLGVKGSSSRQKEEEFQADGLTCVYKKAW